MKPRLKSTRAARDLIKAHEPFLATAERRGKRWVVGYGHTAAAKEGVTLKPEEADLLLIYDVMRAEQTLDASVGAEMAAPMRDALVSFALSVGLRAFKVSDVARLARDGRHREAAAAIETWVRAENDGRLVVSDRLVTRRAAEKALYLSALEDSAAIIDAPAVVSAEPEVSEADAGEALVETQDDDAETIEAEAPEVEAASEEPDESEPHDDADDSAALVELDIAFELPEDAGAVPVAALTGVQAEPVEETERLEAEGEAEQPVSESHDVEETPVEEPRDEPAVLADSAPEPDTSSEDVKAAQDAAIAEVMARMARQVSASITPVAEMEPTEPVMLGYSFLSTAHVGLESAVESETAQPAPTPEPAPAVRPTPNSGSLFAAPSVPLSPMHSALQTSSIKVTPIAPEALPQAATEEDEDPARTVELADREDAISVQVPPSEDAEPVQAVAEPAPVQAREVFSAPPHPALAPASAPGLSGDVEGPDHPDKDIDDPQPDLHEDVEVLEPALVSGADASQGDEAEPAQRRGGDLMFISSLTLGGVMVGLGGWDIAANMDAYMELGLAYSPLGPTVFGAGVLLSAASAWFIIGRRNEK